VDRSQVTDGCYRDTPEIRELGLACLAEGDTVILHCRWLPLTVIP
jgi:hypothetical protein